MSDTQLRVRLHNAFITCSVHTQPCYVVRKQGPGVRRPVSSLPFLCVFNKYILCGFGVPSTLKATMSSVTCV